MGEAAGDTREGGEPAGEVPSERPGASPYRHGERDLATELVRQGLALAHYTCDDAELQPGELERALAAAREAQLAGRGLFATRPVPAAMAFPLGGVALPMHHKRTPRDYAWELAEIADLGASWVNLLVVTQVDDVASSVVPLATERTPTDERIRTTIRAAHELGLKVQLMPIVILRRAEPKDWRGTLRPTEPRQWWLSYDRFLCHMADLAAEAGAEALSVGSEFASLEAEESAWRRLITNVRLRYPGHLTYSANWDHFASVPFWDALDFASMTAYFTLCPKVELPADATNERDTTDRKTGGDESAEPLVGVATQGAALAVVAPGGASADAAVAHAAPANEAPADTTAAQGDPPPRPPTPFPPPFADLEACVHAGWSHGLSELRRLAAASGLPAVFSEVGVPSVEGALAGPWNYTLKAAPDPEAQALAFRVFREVFLPNGEPAPGFGGCFLYDYWGEGGLEDKSYTPRGKPAASEWQALLRGITRSAAAR
ncbi:MAG: hypothetical protein H8D72_01025 [Planctomycetes bacterium]|nr:hypothetical protein [Planctomycetota bacterium]